MHNGATAEMSIDVGYSVEQPGEGRRAEIARNGLRLCKSSPWPCVRPPWVHHAEHCTTLPLGPATLFGAPVPPESVAEWAKSWEYEASLVPTRQLRDCPSGKIRIGQGH